MTPKEYLEIERNAGYKSEYLSGQMFAMAGASREHNLIAGNSAGRVEKYLRQSDGNWLYSRIDGLESEVILESLGCRLSMAEIFARVTFPTEELGTIGAGENLL